MKIFIISIQKKNFIIIFVNFKWYLKQYKIYVVIEQDMILKLNKIKIICKIKRNLKYLDDMYILVNRMKIDL